MLARRLARRRRAGRAAVLADEGGAPEARGRHRERHRDRADAGHAPAAHDPPGRRGGAAAGARRGRARPPALGRADRGPRGGGQRGDGARRQRPVLLPTGERDPSGPRGDDGRRLGDPAAPRRRLRLDVAEPGRAGAGPAVLRRHGALRRQLPGRDPAHGDRQRGPGVHGRPGGGVARAAAAHRHPARHTALVRPRRGARHGTHRRPRPGRAAPGRRARPDPALGRAQPGRPVGRRAAVVEPAAGPRRRPAGAQLLRVAGVGVGAGGRAAGRRPGRPLRGRRSGSPGRCPGTR